MDTNISKKTYRVMAEQETGEELCYATGLDYDDAQEARDEARENHVEWRNVWIELEEDPYERYKSCFDDEQDYGPY